MASTKRYYSLQEVATLLRVPEHQARRWIRRFLTLPPHKTLRVPAEALPLLRRVREGAYLHRLRGAELEAFVRGEKAPEAPPPWPDYPLLLQELLSNIEAALQELEALAPPEDLP